MENLDRSNNKNVSLSLIAEYGASDSDSDDTETISNDNTDSDAAELSEMVLKNNIINACAHGPLSKPRDTDDVEISSHIIIDNSDADIVEYEVTEYRDAVSDSDSSTSDSSNSDVDFIIKDIEELLSSGDETEVSKPEPPRVHGELGLDDLPPIEDLAISLPSQETTKIGTIASVVDRLVIVRAFPDTPAVDLDSILFLDNGAKALGRVFDVFGPVTEPHYCVRFNSREHVRERGAMPGADVYIAPRTPHTNYLFLTELMKMKGSDASWLNDIEPPPHQVDYSDDEEERRANKVRKEQQKQKQQESSDGDTSKKETVKKPEVKRNQRPSESSSRFGSGPSRGRNPFSAGSRRYVPTPNPRFHRQWSNDWRMPPPNHPDQPVQYIPPPSFGGPPILPPFNPSTPPPFMGNPYQFGFNPRMYASMSPMSVPPFVHNAPVFGSNFCNGAGQPQWVNNGPPPPPGT